VVATLATMAASLASFAHAFGFSIISPLMACVVADIFFMKYLPYLKVNRENQQPCMMTMAFHFLIQIIIDFGLSFPIFLLLTSLLCSLLYLLCSLLCKTLAGWALKSFSNGGLCWSLGEDNEQCTLLVVASD
jgi:hypothetical protein